MDPVGLIASCVNIIQGVEVLYKFAQENVHTAGTARSQLGALLARCSACKGIIEGIKIQAELDKDSGARLFLLDHVAEPIKALDNAIKLIVQKLGKVSKYIVFGKIVSESMEKSLRTFDDTLRILQLALQVDQFSVTSAAREVVRDIKSDVKYLNAAVEQLSQNIAQLSLQNSKQSGGQQQELEEEVDARQKMRTLLSSIEVTRLYETFAEKAYPGTGKWFLQGPLNQWLNCKGDTQRVLWLQGPSGTGKTTLMTSAIQQLHAITATEKSALVYFFCSVSLGDTRSPANILGSMLVQLADQKPALWLRIMEWKDNLAGQQKNLPRKPHLDDILEMFKRACDTFHSFTLVLDAPNEAENPEKVLHVIGQLLHEFPGLRVLLSSTPDLEASALCYDNILNVRMDSSNVNTDIHKFVEAKMTDEDQLQEFPQDLKDKALAKILERANGSFRWTECQLSAIIENATSEAEVYQSIEDLSSTLEELYTNTLIDLPSPQARIMRAALLWLAFAVRPLHIDEVEEAMVFREGMDEIRQVERLLPGKAATVLRKCRMLLNHDVSTDMVSLAHSSVRDFLLSPSCAAGKAKYFHLNYELCTTQLLYLAISYLNMKDLSNGHVSSASEWDKRIDRFPLLVYASDAWIVYSERVRWDNNATYTALAEKALRKFFDSWTMPRGGSFGAWTQIYEPHRFNFNLNLADSQPLSTPLYYAARSGLVETARIILRIYGKECLEVPGGSTSSTPVHVAAAYGHAAMVRFLLEQGANPNERNKCGSHGERGIAWADFHEYHDIVQMFLDYSAAPITESDRRAVLHRVGDGDWTESSETLVLDEDEDEDSVAIDHGPSE